MNDTVIIFCAFSFVCWAVLHSAWNIKMLCWKAVCRKHFQRLIYISRMYMPEQNVTSYFLCNILTLTFSTKT